MWITGLICQEHWIYPSTALVETLWIKRPSVDKESENQIVGFFHMSKSIPVCVNVENSF